MDGTSSDAERLLSSRRNALTTRVQARPGEIAHELGEIDAALARIAQGTFGICELCGGAIGRDRLRALPEVRRCLRCSR